MGALNNLIPFSLIVWGQTEIARGLAAILNATTPLYTVLLAHLLTTDERLTSARFAGVLAGFAGVVMIGPAALEGVAGPILAQLACLAAALSYALAGTFGRRLRHQPPLVAAAGQVTMSTLLILPLALLVDRPWTLAPPGPATWSALLGIALLSTALAYVIYFRILARAGATNLLLVTFLIPVSSSCWASASSARASRPAIWRHGADRAAIDGRPGAWLARRRQSRPFQLRP